jgi:hypothetical protein
MWIIFQICKGFFLSHDRFHDTCHGNGHIVTYDMETYIKEDAQIASMCITAIHGPTELICSGSTFHLWKTTSYTGLELQTKGKRLLQMQGNNSIIVFH